ncbi:MAG: PhoU domain-containing protein [Acidimicrobiia bacterium]|nr:PhoU domain-containing protein [Acidimicrobiia bacterium]
MVMEFFRKSDSGGLERIEQQIIRMLVDTRHEFDEAMSSLVGGADPTVLGPDIRVTDGRINASEREIRRELVVHASVQGAEDVSTILAYMIVIKKIERIGDNAKNIFDLATEGVRLEDAPDIDVHIRFRDRLSEMIAATAEIFGARDQDRAAEFIANGDELRKEFDQLVVELIHSDAPASEAVPRHFCTGT